MQRIAGLWGGRVSGSLEDMMMQEGGLTQVYTLDRAVVFRDVECRTDGEEFSAQVYLMLSLSHTRSLSLSLSLSHTLPLPHTHTHKHTLSLSHTNTLSLSQVVVPCAEMTTEEWSTVVTRFAALVEPR
jgi:hypothetical protein